MEQGTRIEAKRPVEISVKERAEIKKPDAVFFLHPLFSPTTVPVDAAAPPSEM